MDLNYRESDEEVVKIEPNSSFTDGQDMTFGLGLDQAPFGSQLPQSLPPQHLMPQQMSTAATTTPQSAKKVSGRVERAARIAELFDAGSPRVRLDHFVYKGIYSGSKMLKHLVDRILKEVCKNEVEDRSAQGCAKLILVR